VVCSGLSAGIGESPAGAVAGRVWCVGMSGECTPDPKAGGLGVRLGGCICVCMCICYARRMTKELMGNRVIRVPGRLWQAAKARADQRGETVSEAVRKFLERYAK